MQKKPIEYLDYFFVLRPMLFFPGWATLLAGYFIAHRRELFFNWQQINQSDHHTIILLLLAFALAMGASFLLNQMRDVESDRANHKLFLVAEGHLKQSLLILEVVLLTMLALYLGWCINRDVFITILLFIILTGYLYNFRPFVLKDVPLGSLLANIAMGGLAFSTGWLAQAPFSGALVIDMLPYLFLNSALYLFTTLPDVQGDRSSRKRTLAVLYGLRPVIRLAFLFYLLALGASIWVLDYMCLTMLVVLAPFFVFTIRNYSLNSTVRTTKYAILVFALAICLKWPYFFILMLAGFMATRWYFKHRFQFDYPNFKG